MQQKAQNNRNLPILFLHGWGGNKNSFLPIQNYFNNYTKTISIDLPVSKDSVLTLDDYKNIALDAIKPYDKVNIIAHSFGGRIALLLSSSTDIVEKQVLTGCAGLIPRLTFKRWLKKVRKIPSPDYAALNYIQKQTFKNIVNTNLKPVLSDVNANTLLIFGEKDNATPLYMAKTLNKNIKMCKLIIYKKCTHFAYLEKMNKFIADCENFLFKRDNL
ncbi:MAG: alpha/beta hydrolase [Firmicutes bacterium]|nr:alpha/beta hydrolase [Bacillota bacterium]